MKLSALALTIMLASGCATTAITPPDPVKPNMELVTSAPWPDPTRYEEAIEKFEAEGTQPQNAIVAVGSSSMGGWHPYIDEDLKPLTIIKRGFGGSFMNDALHYADRIIIPYRPRAVILYEGDNDVSRKISPEAILETYRALQYKIHSELPETRIYIISVKPSPSRWSLWPQMAATNALLEWQAEQDPRVTFIDVASPMIGSNNEPLPEIFLGDKLHMNRGGYDIWREAVRPIVMEKEKEFEKKAK